ncbi:MAG: hypothetical protein HYX48_04285 [Chlamydiales bacterium]|nr:hypothetical protein [Chlamydiales bacterium]
MSTYTASLQLPLPTPSLEQWISDAEYYLTDWAQYPVIGTPAGALQAVMGAVQLVAAVALAILLVLPSCISEDARALFLRSISHIVHGAGNIICGALQSIPFVALLLNLLRPSYAVVDKGEAGEYRCYVVPSAIPPDQALKLEWAFHTGQEGKFVGYAHIAAADSYVRLGRECFLGRLHWHLPLQVRNMGHNLDDANFQKSTYLFV